MRHPKLSLADRWKQWKGLALKRGEDDVRQSVIVVIAKIGPHSGDCVAIVLQCNACIKRDFGKRSVPLVMKQKIRHRVVSDEYVRIAVAIIVRNRDTHSFACCLSNPASGRHIFKFPATE